MVLENIKYNEVIHKKMKKCEFCGRELNPMGLDYLYANFSPDNIEYERCTCKKAQKYWKEKDKQDYETSKREIKARTRYTGKGVRTTKAYHRGEPGTKRGWNVELRGDRTARECVGS